MLKGALSPGVTCRLEIGEPSRLRERTLSVGD